MSAAFEAYRAGGRIGGRYAIGKSILGFLICLVVLTVGTVVGLTVALGVTGYSFTDLPSVLDDRAAVSLPPEDAQILSMALLFATLFGLAWLIPGVWMVQRILHGRPFNVVLGAERRIKWGALALGALIAGALAPAGTFIAAEFGVVEISTRELPAFWAIVAPLFVVMIFLQSAAEEVLFRGYLLQTLAGRYRSMILWAIIPSLLFAVLHFSGGALEDSIAYIVAVFAFGLFASALVWRTGGISLPIGFHAGNNVMALLLFEPPFGVEGIGLFSIEIAEGALTTLVAVECALFLVVFLILARIAPVETPRPAGPWDETAAADGR